MIVKEKNEGIQFLRAVAAILVFIHHDVWHCLEHFKYDLVYLTKTHIGSMGVGVFFVISGFVITLSMHQNKMFFVNRMLRIYPPFWFLVILSSIIFTNSQFTLSSILLIPSLEFNGSYRIHYWTLVYEMFFYAIVYIMILLKVSKEGLLKLMALWLMIIIVMNLFIEFNNYRVPHFKIFFSPINLFFIFGVCIALNRQTYDAIPAYQLLVTIVIGYQFLSTTSGALFYTIQALVCSAILLFFVKLKVPRFCGMLGDCSYGLYLVHDIVVMGIIGLVGRYGINIKFYQLCGLIFVLAGIVGIVYGYAESKFHRRVAYWIKQKSRLLA